VKRRNFISTTALAGFGIAFSSCKTNSVRNHDKTLRGTFSQTDNKVSIYTTARVKATRIFHITDTHLSIDDERGLKYQQYSKRMAAAYKSNRNFKTGELYSAKESFEQTLQLAKEQEVDFLALTGDIFSFPSEAAVEWVLQKLNNTGIPFAYVAGNHDWHYEGMKGSEQQLRETWTKKHLLPMYQGKKPMFASYDFNGIRFVCIDNSTYEILPEQLTFFKKQVQLDMPIVLLMHIPLYMPGRPIGYGCANPEWCEVHDTNFKIERREKWEKGGHTKVTFDFYDEVFNAPNLVSILTGHIHRAAIDIKNGIPQIVSGLNAAGYYTDIKIDSI